MFVVINFLILIAIVWGGIANDSARLIKLRFTQLKCDLQKIHQLEDTISKIKYINETKISFELMETVTKFDLFCQTQFPQQIINLEKFWICWNQIALLWNKRTPVLEYNEFVKILKLIENWKYLKQEFINLKVVLLEVIYNYVEYENQLEILYNKYESKENLMNLMEEIPNLTLTELQNLQTLSGGLDGRCES
jgi:hypothetical protein